MNIDFVKLVDNRGAQNSNPGSAISLGRFHSVLLFRFLQVKRPESGCISTFHNLSVLRTRGYSDPIANPIYKVQKSGPRTSQDSHPRELRVIESVL
jgi:hypothetical protein